MTLVADVDYGFELMAKLNKRNNNIISIFPFKAGNFKIT
jgi:hypothetical protein